MITTILFDLDGTLIDFCDEHYFALNDALREISGFQISRQEHETIYNGLPTKVKLEKLANKSLIKSADIPRINELKQKLTQERIKKIKTDWSKVEMMQSLYDLKYNLGCVTNCIKQSCISMLKNLGVYEYMDIIVTNEDVENNKPAPDPYLYACDALYVEPANVLAVEDTNKGIISAETAGCNTMLVKNATELTKYNLFKNIDDITRKRVEFQTLFDIK